MRTLPWTVSPVWAVISRVLPEQHKERVVLLTSSQTTPDNLAPYLPEALQPPHIRADALAGGWPEPTGGADAMTTAVAPNMIANMASAAAPNAAVPAVTVNAAGATQPEAEAAGWFASASSYFSSYTAEAAPAPAAPAGSAPDS